MGISGVAALKYFKYKNKKLFIYDDNITPNKNLRIFWKNYLNWDWRNLDKIIISPGIPISGKNKHPIVDLAKKFKIRLVNEIELLFDNNPKAKIVGITGTNGKSTLVSLISHILTGNKISNVIAGNFGNPACLIKDPGKNGVIILELSSYQLNSIPSLKIDFCSILNISNDHIDYHNNFNSYLNSKLKLIRAIKDNGKIIINKNQIFLMEKIKNFIKKNQTKAEIIYTKNVKINSKVIFGKHNLELFEIALIICKNLSIHEKEIKKAISNFQPLPHRMETIYKKKGITIINDSKATNGNSTSVALKTFKNIYWIAGGLKKKDGLGESLNYLTNVKQIHLIGSSKDFFQKQLIKINFKNPVYTYVNLEDAINKILDEVKQKKFKKYTILFSPAAASFDEFKNFEHRGKVFKQMIIDKFIGL